MLLFTVVANVIWKMYIFAFFSNLLLQLYETFCECCVVVPGMQNEAQLCEECKEVLNVHNIFVKLMSQGPGK